MFKDIVVANRSVTELAVKEEEHIDDISIQVMKKDCPDFVLAFKTLEMNGQVKFRYELSGGVRLSYIPQIMSKGDFILLLIGMLEPFRTCSDWFMDYHNICLEKDYIFVSQDRRTVKYIYVPIDEYSMGDEYIKKFFFDLIVWIKLNDDPGYNLELLRILQNSDMTILDLLETVKKSSGIRKTEQPKEVMKAGVPEEKVGVPAEKIAEKPVEQPDGADEIKKADFGKDNVLAEILGGLEEEPNGKKGKKEGNLFGHFNKKEKKESGEDKKRIRTIKRESLFSI